MTKSEADVSSLFVRKATGLVRAWSVWDAFIYATFSINLVTLGLYIFSQMYFLEGGMLPTLLISAVFILAECVVYAALVAVMPRSGGDYVWQSRILGGGIGFVLAVTGWWFILWLWVPLYGDMLRHIFLTPVLGILGARDADQRWDVFGFAAGLSDRNGLYCFGNEVVRPHSKSFVYYRNDRFAGCIRLVVLWQFSELSDWAGKPGAGFVWRAAGCL
jgi:hypothetical protein